MPAVDHLVIPVPALDEAAGTLESAGFVVTPRAAHPFGTANRLVVFDGTYLELVEIADRDAIPETGFAREVAERLADGRTGISHIALRARSITAAAELAAELEVEASEPVWFSREAPRVDGSRIEASFTLLGVEGAPVFFCVHHTPAAIWFRAHTDHTNGAIGIGSVRARLGLPFEVDDVGAGSDRIGISGYQGPESTIAGVAIGAG